MVRSHKTKYKNEKRKKRGRGQSNAKKRKKKFKKQQKRREKAQKAKETAETNEVGELTGNFIFQSIILFVIIHILTYNYLLSEKLENLNVDDDDLMDTEQ